MITFSFSFHRDLEQNDHVLFFLFIGILSFGSRPCFAAEQHNE